MSIANKVDKMALKGKAISSKLERMQMFKVDETTPRKRSSFTRGGKD